MSLQTLRELRMNGARPAAPITVFVGDKRHQDSPDLVTVTPGANPASMDWRPVIGLCVLVVVQSKAYRQTVGRIIDELERIDGVKVFGVAEPDAVFPMLSGADDKHKIALEREWRALCN